MFHVLDRTGAAVAPIPARIQVVAQHVNTYAVAGSNGCLIGDGQRRVIDAAYGDLDVALSRAPMLVGNRIGEGVGQRIRTVVGIGRIQEAPAVVRNASVGGTRGRTDVQFVLRVGIVVIDEHVDLHRRVLVGAHHVEDGRGARVRLVDDIGVGDRTDDDDSLDPFHLFNEEESGGNGRTCATCHTVETGTISPAQVQALYASDPSAPLFRSTDSDDGAGNDYTRLLEHATVRVRIALPAGVTLMSDPSATSVVLNRSVPTTINTPGLDPVLMWDGRAPSLTAQALDASLGHAQATVTPTDNQLALIAEFEQGAGFFSSDTLWQYSQGGDTPTLPPAVTESEQRGRRFFVDSFFGICGQCHGGPMLNETTTFSGLGVGTRFQTVSVSEFNTQGNPSYDFAFPDPENPGETVTITSPDPGRALITGDIRDVNKFKIPTLWGISKTAPYFHDNSANTLEELMDHYQDFLSTFRPISDQDKAPQASMGPCVLKP